MAYINPQYQIDMQQDQRANENYRSIGNSIVSALETNRARALEARRLELAAKEQGQKDEIYKGQKAELDYKAEQRALPFDQQDDYKRQLGIAAIKAKSKGNGENLTFEQKEQIKSKYRKETKQEAQPAQNEFAAAGYAKRARQAEAELANIPAEAGTGWEARFSSIIPNELRSGNYQVMDQAKRNFISANLRKESGAAISDAEFANEDKKYFPQPGDNKDVIAQKARAREQAMLNLEAEGARALPKIGNAPQAPQPQAQPQRQPGQAPKAVAQEDQAAIQWAQSNPNDPRAQKILQLHGVK